MLFSASGRRGMWTMVVVLVTLMSSGLGASMFNHHHEVEDYVLSRIDSSEIMIFSKSYCPYCKATKELLTEILQQEKFSKVRMDVVELDKFPDPETGAEIQAYLEKRTGQRTVPNVFIDKQHVGGNSDVQAKHQEGGLEPWILSSLDDDFEDAVEL